MIVTSHPGRGTASKSLENAHRVDGIVGPRPAALITLQSPAVMTTGRNVEQARRRVPGQKIVALHIAVISEQFPFRIDIKVVWIAESVGQNLGAVSIGLETQQGA